jgi:hypothetical protein
VRQPAEVVERTCGHCGKKYHRKLWRVRREGAKYCSRSCYDASRSSSAWQKFWANTHLCDDTGCIEWSGKPLQRLGYGRLRINGRQVRAHRYAYELCYGTIPDGKMVLHDCDNRICVRPDHLYVGTGSDNMQDMAWRGRAAGFRRKGVGHPMARLTEDDVRNIRYRCRRHGESGGDATAAELAAHYGVSVDHIYGIVRGDTWDHIPGYRGRAYGFKGMG